MLHIVPLLKLICCMCTTRSCPEILSVSALWVLQWEQLNVSSTGFFVWHSNFVASVVGEAWENIIVCLAMGPVAAVLAFRDAMKVFYQANL